MDQIVLEAWHGFNSSAECSPMAATLAPVVEAGGALVAHSWCAGLELSSPSSMASRFEQSSQRLTSRRDAAAQLPVSNAAIIDPVEIASHGELPPMCGWALRRLPSVLLAAWPAIQPARSVGLTSPFAPAGLPTFCRPTCRQGVVQASTRRDRPRRSQIQTRT